MRPQRIVRPDTAFSLGKTKRPRRVDNDHLKWIRTLPCLVTGKRPVEAAHVRYANYGMGKRETGKSEKPDDRWTVPLSADEHRKQHDAGDERSYWNSVGIDPCMVALALYGMSGDDEAAEVIIRNARAR